MIPDAPQPSPSTLAEQTRTSEAEFGHLFQEIRPRLLRYVASVTRNHAAAEDVVQQTADYALNKLRDHELQITTPKRFFSYCARKAYWLSLTHLDHMSREPLPESSIGREDEEYNLDSVPHPPETHNILDLQTLPEIRILLRKVRGDLSEEERTIFSMTCLGHSAQKIGDVLDKEPNNIIQIRFRATKRILGKYGVIKITRRASYASRRQKPTRTTGADSPEGGSAL